MVRGGMEIALRIPLYVWWGIIASLAAGLATGAGALPVIFTRRVSDRLMDGMLGFAAGVMLAATSFSLIIPALRISGVAVVSMGLIAGGIFLHLADRLIPHLHFVSGTEGPASRLRRTWLFIFAITIHNFPEGLAVGVGFGSGDVRAGTALAIAIGLQNMPEGLAVALPLIRERYSRNRALSYATLTGLIEPIGGILGVIAVSFARPLLPLALSFAAGAMLYVISDEIIPETHSRGFEREATAGVIIGFVLMLILDNLF